MLFLHEHRLPVERPRDAYPPLGIEPVELGAYLTRNLVHEAGELHVVGDDVLAPPLFLETGDDGQEVCHRSILEHQVIVHHPHEIVQRVT